MTTLTHPRLAVILGASGYVGGGAVRAFLDAGYEVVGVSRSPERLAKMRTDVRVTPDEAKRLHDVVADFATETSAVAAEAAVAKALGGRVPLHVVSAQGFVHIRAGATASTVEEVKSSLDDGLWNNFLAAKVLLPKMKDVPGATFTLVSGGMAHAVFAPAMWIGTLKNQAVHSLTYGLAKEFESSAVRVNCVCIHLALAPNAEGASDKNQLGMKAAGTGVRFGPVFTHLAAVDTATRGKVVCVESWEDVDKRTAEVKADKGKA